MANKIKNHSVDVLSMVKAIGTELYAKFIANKTTMTKVCRDTGLSANSIKTIFSGNTANLASYLAVAKSLGYTLSLGSINLSMEDDSSTSKFLQEVPKQ